MKFGFFLETTPTHSHTAQSVKAINTLTAPLQRGPPAQKCPVYDIKLSKGGAPVLKI